MLRLLVACMLCSSAESRDLKTLGPQPVAKWTKLLPAMGLVLKRLAGQLQSKDAQHMQRSLENIAAGQSLAETLELCTRAEA